MAAVARNKQEQTIIDFFRILSSGELEAIRAKLAEAEVEATPVTPSVEAPPP